MSAHCRSCQAPILWYPTESGKSTPLDEKPVLGGNITLVEIDQQTVAKVVRGEPDRLGYVSHFKSCPDAGKYRKKR